ncbi:hypothetical protein QQF64_006803 [Cirrhinus molitorella]|uniref:Uncharacterized protein n=1 Tax=Cirrhinus molitorella TaxID=172907 RepID=A0ABR3M8V8_9TELE
MCKNPPVVLSSVYRPSSRDLSVFLSVCLSFSLSTFTVPLFKPDSVFSLTAKTDNWVAKPLQNRTVLNLPPKWKLLLDGDLKCQLFWVRSEKETCWFRLSNIRRVSGSLAERRHRFGGFSLFSCFPIIFPF